MLSLQQLLLLHSANNSSSNVACRGLAAPFSFTAQRLLQLLLQLTQFSNFSLGCVCTCPAAFSPASLVCLCDYHLQLTFSRSCHVLTSIVTFLAQTDRWLLKALEGSTAKHSTPVLLMCMTMSDIAAACRSDDTHKAPGFGCSSSKLVNPLFCFCCFCFHLHQSGAQNPNFIRRRGEPCLSIMAGSTLTLFANAAWRLQPL